MSDVTGISNLTSTSTGATSLTGIKAAVANLNADKKEASDISSAVSTHAALITGVHGLVITAGKTITVPDNATVSGSNTGDQTLPVKAAGSDVDTGTNDAKFLTAKAVNDSHNVPSVAPGSSGNVMSSNGTDWVSTAAGGGKQIWITRMVQGTPDVLDPGGGAVENAGNVVNGTFVAPFTGFLRNFSIKTGANVPATSATAFARKNGSNTTLTVNISNSGTNTVYSDTTHTVAITAGDTVDFYAAGLGGGTFNMIMWAVELTDV